MANHLGQRNFRLGAIEITILGAGALLLAWSLRQQYQAFQTTQQETSRQVSALVIQVSNLSAQIQALTEQMADVPGLRQKVIEMQTVQQEHERRLVIVENYLNAPPPSRSAETRKH